jgi:hypothetical protein
MKTSRTILPSEVLSIHFAHQDVLEEEEQKEQRKVKLHRAMLITNSEHVPVSLYLRLPSGETVETQSDMIDFADDFVIMKGGFFIPVHAILDVDA